MARITVEDCLKKVESQYDLVLLAKERTSQINSGAEILVEADNDKNTVIALREIAQEKIPLNYLKLELVKSFQKNTALLEELEESEKDKK